MALRVCAGQPAGRREGGARPRDREAGALAFHSYGANAYSSGGWAFGGPIGRINPAPSFVLNGATAGSIYFVFPFGTDGVKDYKKFVGWAAGYQNATATPQTASVNQLSIGTVNSFQLGAQIVANAGMTGATISTSTLTLPASMASPVTGLISIEGI